MTKTANRVVLPFQLKEAKFLVTVTTDGYDDKIEDIWNDIWSYVFNVSGATENFEGAVAEVFEDYPDYSYKIEEDRRQ